MEQDKKYTVIIPAYNEEEAIVSTVEGVKKVTDGAFEILVVDDGSRDKTFDLAKSCNVRVIKHEKNQGKAAALETGVMNAKGDIVATIDADCTYEAGKIRELVKLIENGTDLAIGSRFLGRAEGLKMLNRAGNWIFSSLISLFTGQRVTDAQSGLRAFRKDLFFRLAVRAKGLDWETEMTARAVREGYSVVEIPIEYYERVGISKLHPFKDGYRMLRGVLRGTRPLSGIRSALLRNIINRHISPGSKILYIGIDGGSLVSHLANRNTIHVTGKSESPIAKNIIWTENIDTDYDYTVITNLQDVIEDVELLKFAYSHLKKGGKTVIWLSNPNAHAILSWFMLLGLIGKIVHIRYYSGNIIKILEYTGFVPVLFERCNLHINILVIGRK